MDKSWFLQQPKGEHHVHLEGSLRFDRIMDWATQDSDHAWHGLSEAQVRSHFNFCDFPAFIQCFKQGYRLLRGAARYQAAVEDLCAGLSEQGVRCADVLYSPGVACQILGEDLRAIHDGIEAGLSQAAGSLKVRFVLDTVLNLGPEFMARTLDAVLADRRSFLHAFSVGGGCERLTMDPFLFLFERAQQEALAIYAHSGEVDGPENMESVIANTDVQRIAHGLAAARSEKVRDMIRRRGIVIDVCLTSNLATGLVDHLGDHPARDFPLQGLRVALATDDPAYFSTTLLDEYLLAEQYFGWDIKTLLQESLAGF